LAAEKQKNAFRLSPASIILLEEYCKALLQFHKAHNPLKDKLEAIDIAYARFQVSKDQSHTPTDGSAVSGTDIVAGNTACGITEKDITVPVVISQVDSFRWLPC
jgi:hypothetical protein